MPQYKLCPTTENITPTTFTKNHLSVPTVAVCQTPWNLYVVMNSDCDIKNEGKYKLFIAKRMKIAVCYKMLIYHIRYFNQRY